MESADILVREGIYPESTTEGHLGVDNFTVAWMLNIAVHASGNPFVSSLLNEFSGPFDVDQVGRVKAWAEDPDGLERGAYSRYWHGYLIYLKPLLVFFDIRQIRFLFQTIFVLLVASAVISLVRRLGDRGPFVAMALVFSYAVMHGFDAVTVLPMFPSFAISVIGILWALRARDDRRSIVRGFLLLGAFTVFFDMLDNPVLTAGMPAAIVLVRFIDVRSSKWLLTTLLLSMLAWCCAYGFVWAMKWILCTIVTGHDIIGEAIRQVGFRSGVSGQEGRDLGIVSLTAILRNLRIRDVIIPVVLTLFLICAVLFVLRFVRGRRELAGNAKLWTGVGLFALVGVLPYLWYAVIGNHSALHSFFTYRDQIITVFALLTCAQWLWRGKGPKGEGFASRGTEKSDIDRANRRYAEMLGNKPGICSYHAQYGALLSEREHSR